MSEKREKEKLTLHSLNLNLLTQVRSLQSKLAQVTFELENVTAVKHEYRKLNLVLEAENTRYREALKECSKYDLVDEIAKAALNGPPAEASNPSMNKCPYCRKAFK